MKPTIFGNYALIKKIGKGGMAEIFLATPIKSPQFLVVIKKINPELVEDKHYITMFLDEAKLMSCLIHPNIIQILDVGEVKGEYYICMEYVHGKDLLTIIEYCVGAGIRIPEDIGLHIMLELLEGLDYIHNVKGPDNQELKVIHRDLSPSNILISLDGEVKIGDFGIAKTALQKNVTRAGYIKGKIGYMSPEQVEGKKLDHRTDVYVAGLVLYEIFAQSMYFNIDNEFEALKAMREAKPKDKSELSKYMSPGLIDILYKALKKDPDERFQTALDFSSAIMQYMIENRLSTNVSILSSFMRSLFPTDETLLEQVHNVSKKSSVIVKPLSYKKKESKGSPKTLKFFLKDKHGKVVGPFLVDVLINIIKIYNLPSNTLASTDNKSFKPLDQYPEFIEAFQCSPEDRTGLFSLNPQYQGLLSEISVTKLFYRFASAKVTGKLVFRNGDIEKIVYLRDGFPEHIETNKKDELFGEILVSRKIITRTSLSLSLKEQEKKKQKIGNILIEKGYIKPADLIKLLTEQMRIRYFELFNWRDGQYQFYACSINKNVANPMGMGAFALISEAVRNRMNYSIIEETLSPLLTKKIRFAKERVVNPENFRLTQEELKITYELNNMSVNSIYRRFRMTSNEVIDRLVYLLYQTEIITFEE
ncbi:MAG: serine/threonine protein kinase [Deltaproteobacteria bacterium]|nr:serine/threonine protein kinase [Deltaproteobacteria bacterium]